MKKFAKFLIYIGMCCLLTGSVPGTAYAEETDPGILMEEWKEMGHATTYGMVPIHGCDVKDGTWEVGKIRSGKKFEDIVLEASEGEMTLIFHASKDDMDQNFPGWEESLTLTAVTEDSEIVPVETVLQGDTLEMKVSFDALNQDHTLASGENGTSFWINAADLPEEALKIDVPDYSVIREALSTLAEDVAENKLVNDPFEPMAVDLEDGDYAIEAEIFGGSGKAAVDTPTYLYVREGKAYARLRWSSSNYDYMIVGGQRYENEAEVDKNSIFTIPVQYMDQEMTVVADTLAMGTPHEITYGLKFYSSTIGDVSQMPQEAAKRVVVIAFIIIIGGGILNHYVKKKRGINTGKKKKKH